MNKKSAVNNSTRYYETEFKMLNTKRDRDLTELQHIISFEHFVKLLSPDFIIIILPFSSPPTKLMTEIDLMCELSKGSFRRTVGPNSSLKCTENAIVLKRCTNQKSRSASSLKELIKDTG